MILGISILCAMRYEMTKWQNAEFFKEPISFHYLMVRYKDGVLLP